MTININPIDDGVTHINVYSKGKTEIGRFLSNFAYAPALTPDGHFCSIEGYWYWLSCKDDRLRELNGWEAKKLGRELGASDWLEELEFKNKIKEAIKLKLKTYPSRLEQLKKINIPLAHYYVYGNKVVNVPNSKWIIDFIEELKNEA